MLTNNEYELLKITQQKPDTWFMTDISFINDIKSLMNHGLIEVNNETSTIDFLIYRYPSKTLH
jgi:hypothetical protein